MTKDIDVRRALEIATQRSTDKDQSLFARVKRFDYSGLIESFLDYVTLLVRYIRRGLWLTTVLVVILTLLAGVSVPIWERFPIKLPGSVYVVGDSLCSSQLYEIRFRLFSNRYTFECQDGAHYPEIEVNIIRPSRP